MANEKKRSYAAEDLCNAVESYTAEAEETIRNLKGRIGNLQVLLAMADTDKAEEAKRADEAEAMLMVVHTYRARLPPDLLAVLEKKTPVDSDDAEARRDAKMVMP